METKRVNSLRKRIEKKKKKASLAQAVKDLPAMWDTCV